MFRIRGSIRNKLILFMLIATILPIVTSIVITYMYNKESVKKTTIQENSNLLFQGKTNLIHYFNLLDEATLTVYNDTKFANIMQRGYENSSDEKSQLLAAIQNIFRSINETYQIHLLPVKGKEQFLYTRGRFLSSAKTAEPTAAGPFSGYQAYLEPTHLSHDYGVVYFPTYGSTPVISYHRPIYNVPSSQLLGLLSVDILPTFIERVSGMLYNAKHEQLYLLDEQGTVVYSGSSELWGKRLTEDWVSHVLSSPDERGSFEWKGEGFSGVEIYEKLQTPYMNWVLVKQIPYSNLYQNARQLAGINVAVFSLFLIVVIAATVYISIKFTSPIRLLITTINKIQTGQLNVDIDVRGTDEIGVLARRFRLMMQTINELILREYALDLANKTNELKALQAQINPHFLNNALQSIGTLALQHQEVKIYSLIASLGKMMRYHMNTNETIVPLSKEIDYVKGYLDLQRQRFDERLQVEVDASPETLTVRLPKMTLQPIVENFFKHGYDSTQGGLIRIECRLNGESELNIAVTDNGRGMEEEERQALAARLDMDPALLGEGQESIGLLNVIQRIKLYFNENARMNISAADPTGLRVELCIPLGEGGTRS